MISSNPSVCSQARSHLSSQGRLIGYKISAPLAKGDSPQCGEMSRSDRGDGRRLGGKRRSRKGDCARGVLYPVDRRGGNLPPALNVIRVGRDAHIAPPVSFLHYSSAALSLAAVSAVIRASINSSRSPFKIAFQSIQSQVDPVVGDPPLGVVVGADALAAVAGAYLAACVRRQWRRRAWPCFCVIQCGPRSTFMALSLFLCWLRSSWHSTTVPVGRWVMRMAEEVLLMCWPPCAGGAESVDLQVLGVQFQAPPPPPPAAPPP